MIRKSIKATLITAAITSSGYLSKSLGMPGFSGWAVVVVPSFVFSVMLGGGAALRVIPRAISSKLTIIAQANDLNLMEDYRKSQVFEQLNFLWDRVFSYESDLRYTDEERSAEKAAIEADQQQIRERINQWPEDMLERLGVSDSHDVDNAVMDLMTASPLSDRIEKSREGFIISSLFALRHSLAQSSQAETIGYRLNLLEDERDGAYFDRTDTQLFEQYFGNTTIADIKKCVGFGRIEGIKELPTKSSRRAWFYFITRKIAIETGKSIKHLNDRYNTDSFNSQVLLWPGEEDAKWLEKLDGARSDVLCLRKAIITNTLGKDYQGACTLLDRMLLPLFKFATKLRFAYDPEYCDGSLSRSADDISMKNNIIDDLTDCGCEPKYISRFKNKAERAAGDMSEFVKYLEARHPDLNADKLVLRAVKIAFHIDANGIKRLFKNRPTDGDTEPLNREIEKAAEREPIYTNRLITSRFHQALTMLQRKGYTDLSAELAYKDDQ